MPRQDQQHHGARRLRPRLQRRHPGRERPAAATGTGVGQDHGGALHGDSDDVAPLVLAGGHSDMVHTHMLALLIGSTEAGKLLW